MSAYRIGELSKRLGLSADTLRYYEKIRLLPCVARDDAGRRIYADKDVSRLKFVQRAQRMKFSLAEIGKLLEMRENPQKARSGVRTLTQKKLSDIEQHMDDLTTLRDELQLLVNLCQGAEEGCPILENIDGEPDEDDIDR